MLQLPLLNLVGQKTNKHQFCVTTQTIVSGWQSFHLTGDCDDTSHKTRRKLLTRLQFYRNCKIFLAQQLSLHKLFMIYNELKLIT